MQLALLGFDFFEAVAAGGVFGTRDFAADIIGGAGVQRPDGGFVQDVIRGLIGACIRALMPFGEGAFGLADFAVVSVGGGVLGGGFIIFFFLLLAVFFFFFFFDFFVGGFFLGFLAGGGDIVGVGTDLFHEFLEVALTLLIVFVFVKQGGADFGAGGPGFEFFDQFIVGLLAFALLFGGEDGVFLGNKVAAAILDKGLMDAEDASSCDWIALGTSASRGILDSSAP